MKTIIRLLVCAGLTWGAAVTMFAGPGPEYWQRMSQAEQFAKLKAGDKVAYVCNQCQTVSEVTLDSSAQAMELCKEGSTVACPMCKKKVKVTMKGARNDPPSRTEVVYVNEKGEECFFVAKASPKK